MSGTSGFINSGGGGLMLPAPKVQMMVPVAQPALFVSDNSPSSGNTVQVTPRRYVKVTVPGIPSAVLGDLATYAPQVELLRYTRRQRRENASGGNGGKGGAYVHPAHGLTPGGGSYTHGGQHGGVDPAIWAIRPTEWPILSGADNIDVTQGILGFMCLHPVYMRDNSGVTSTVDCLIPSHGLVKGRSTSFSRFPYQKSLSGAYFAFRLSIRDPSDARQKRIWGPTSEVVQVGNTAFPFLPDGVSPLGESAAVQNPLHDPKAVNFWTVSRLP